ncbi:MULTISPECIES: PAS domain-containing sensor histidine kinase [Burkholderia]|uniref:PAS domain-containing sensor histidine kinase n=1 Tax=Burkholderia TaxID=32008 RepID=UPI00158C54AA|nr:MULTISPECIES: PAS domain-containing sensor histidine kinase [Burkholderia]MBR8210641.1 PAS domain-containing protein [Burkholderia cenocepacia]MCA8233636.1 PAS domain-containing protein [Burkholderia cenocepacia]
MTQRTRSGSDDGFQADGLINALQTPACYFNRVGEVVGINDAWRVYDGGRVATSRSFQWIELVHAADRSDVLAKLQATRLDQDHVAIECRLDDPRGEGRWFIVNLHRVHDCWLCTCTDIHELKSKEADLKRRVSIQVDMLNVSVDCIKLIGPRGDLLYMNRAGCRALGVDEGAELGMPWLPLLPEDVWDDGNAALDTARRGVFSRFSGRSVIPGKDAQYWDNMLTPILGTDGTTTAILCVSRDVTRERVAHELLRHNEERLAIAARVGGLGVWDYDIVSDTLQCDENWYRTMGRCPSLPIRSLGQLRLVIHHDDVDKAVEVTRFATEGDDAVEYRIVRADGEIRWLRSAAYLQYENGIAKRTVGFVLDITKSRLTEQRREEWLHFLSHDMRSPQSSILALIELEHAAGHGRTVNDMLDRVAGYARRTLALADDFVQLARAEKPMWSLVETHIDDVVLNAVDEMWAQAQARSIVLEANVGDAVCVAQVEPFLLTRAISNLMSNAIKFSPKGSVVTVRLYGVEQGYAIAVSDSGPGISVEAQQGLFEPFRRLRGGFPSCPPGVGLGLAFVKTVAQRHGGTIELRSRAGKGCTFILTLPSNALLAITES